MRKAATLLIALFCFTGCLHDNYTGEPFIHMEYTAYGVRYEYEDWGRMWGVWSFGPISGGNGLQSKQIDANESQARFGLQTDNLTLWLPCDWRFYTDGKRYEYKADPQSNRPYTCILDVPETARMTKGWYILTRKSTEPYCTYEIHFEFTCNGEQGPFEITDGIIQVGRRFQSTNVKEFIKDEERP